MPTTFDDVNVKCPYFRSNKNRDILCEGITDVCITILRFESERKRDLQRDVFCSERYENCKVYRMLEEKYEE
jgi:hypothetical protein